MQATLDKVSNPKGRLADAKVQDKSGASVGAVRDVIRLRRRGAGARMRTDLHSGNSQQQGKPRNSESERARKRN